MEEEEGEWREAEGWGFLRSNAGLGPHAWRRTLRSCVESPPGF